jgi:hypothetical protein
MFGNVSFCKGSKSLTRTFAFQKNVTASPLVCDMKHYQTSVEFLPKPASSFASSSSDLIPQRKRPQTHGLARGGAEHERTKEKENALPFAFDVYKIR